jgi:hypothetical protein
LHNKPTGCSASGAYAPGPEEEEEEKKKTEPDPENRVRDQDNGSPGRPVSSSLQVPGEPFPSWSG